MHIGTAGIQKLYDNFFGRLVLRGSCLRAVCLRLVCLRVGSVCRSSCTDEIAEPVVFREVHTENSQRVVLRISPGRFCTGSVDTWCAACGEQAEQEQSQQRLQCRPRRARACYVCMGIFGFAAHAFTLPCGG